MKSLIALLACSILLISLVDPGFCRQYRFELHQQGSGFAEDRFAESPNDTVPAPLSVMRRSLILPGWGQVVNRQAWKVPIIYALIGGLVGYGFYADGVYNDYRAAYYNSFPENDDFRFGPTPSYINPDTPPESLRETRNAFRNRRDLTIVGVVLAHGLNVLDAYVFAHFRDFDVGDDLSAGFDIKMEPHPFQASQRIPVASFKIHLK